MKRTRILAVAAIAIAPISGCVDQPLEPVAPDVTAERDGAPAPIAQHGNRGGNDHAAGVRKWAREVRRVTRRFHRIDRAASAGYDARLTECLESPAGGMGLHYGNPTLIDGVVEEQAPEVLLYEPLPNGRLRLVAVEYVVPYTAWDGPQPPSLNGVSFHRNDGFGLWVLHLWAWKANPSGILADWNPRVSCRFAD